MTASRRYLPASLACFITLSAGSAGLAAGGSALDPYSNVPAPTSLKGSSKKEKGKKKLHITIIKKAQEAEKIAHDDSTQSQTYVKLPGGGKSKHIKEKETSLAAEPELTPKLKKVKAIPVQTTTKVSDIAPAPNGPKAVAVSGKSDDSVMGGIKTIGEGYSKTFKAASHGVVHSTKAASEAVLAGGKKVSSSFKSGAKASGEVFKKGADMVSHGFKATGEKFKEGTAPIAEKLAKAPAPAPKDGKPLDGKTKEASQSFGAKLAHLPKPKMPKIGIPFISSSGKKNVVVDPQAGASEQGIKGSAADPVTNVAAASKQTPIEHAPKQTPVVDTPQQTAQAPATLKVKPADKSKAGQGLATMTSSVSKKLGKLWPFGHKDNAGDVASKQTQPPM